MSEPNTELTVFFCRHRFPPNSNTCEICGETLPPAVTTPPAELPQSPTPWSTEPASNEETYIVERDGWAVATVYTKRDAALIVASVNRHAELIQLLTEGLHVGAWTGEEISHWTQRVEAALKAEPV